MKRHLGIAACASAALLLSAILCWGSFTPSATAQSEAAPANAKAVPAGAKGEKDERQIKTFTLTNADAEALTKTVQPLFADAGTPSTVIVYDKRTNTMIVRGRESEVAILEAIVFRLDDVETPEKPQN